MGVSIMHKIMIATILTVTTGMVVAQPTFAGNDPVGSALFGGIAGAVIGHAVGGRNGAAVGAAIGSLGGAVVGSNQRPYYGNSYYEQAPVYQRPVYERPVQTTYYAEPAPVNYYSTTYYPQREVIYQREVAYPVSQVTYYGDDDRGSERAYGRGWHRDCPEDHDRGHYWHDNDWHGRGNYRY
jgi:uncharacterized protein YcfJ